MKSNFSRHFITVCICASAALGSKTAAAQSAAPCSLLTSAQVTAAVGVSIVIAVVRPMPPGHCGRVCGSLANSVVDRVEGV